MVLFFKQRIKIIICIFFIIFTIIIIYKQMNTPQVSITQTTKDKETYSKLQIKNSLYQDNNIKLYQKTQNEEGFKEVTSKEIKESIFQNKTIYELETKDLAKPNNISNIKSSILDNYIIISFNEAKDNGTKYEYYIEGTKNNQTAKTETSTIYKESGIKGYNYIIDNIENNEAEYTVNKNDSEPILFTGIDWSKNYYLHIRTIDNSNNYSDNLTYKIELPSKGIKMQYVDLNTYKELSPGETIIGNVNDTYNIKNYNKEISNYKFIKVDGEEQGCLKKERINVKYLYAKYSNIIINHLNKSNGIKIAESNNIEGYEGKDYKISHNNIKNYKYEGGVVSGKMKEGTQIINLYYNEIGKVNISYKDYITGKDIMPNEIVNGIVGNTYSAKGKEIPNYTLYKKEGEEIGCIKSEITNIIYYYKQKANLVVKHIDIDNNNILDTQIIKGYVGDKLNVKSNKYEGYILNEDYENYKNKQKRKLVNNKNSSKEILKENKIEVSNNPNNKEQNIIDEILQEDLQDNIMEKEIKIDEVTKQYDIVMDCGNKEYIIFYKKI